MLQEALKKLNDLSCVGCHQARAHAGFHFLGIDKFSTHPFNSLSFEGSVTFEGCLEKTRTHYGFGRCNENRPCRNDFVCAKSYNGQGYCTPSYFLFQIRLDGHLNPQTGK